MAGFQKIYTSQNQYLEDVARSTGLFDDNYYAIAKESGKDVEYLQLVANAKNNLSSTFDKAFYDKLSGEERFNYFATENYMDKSSEDYKKSVDYFNQRAKQIKNEEIYAGLNGLEKALHSTAGLLGNALLQVGGIFEGLVDVSLMSMNFLAQPFAAMTGNLDELNKKTKELISKDATGYNAAQAAMNDYINAYTFLDKNFVAQTINDVTTGLVRMAPMFIPGVGQAGYAAYLGAAAGNTAQELISTNPDINYWQVFAYTAASTGLEALTEWASGALFGDDIVSSIMKGEKYAPTGNIIKTLAKNSATEGLEEFVAELFGGVLYNAMVGEKEISITDALYAALIGGLTGFLMTGGNVLSTKKMSLVDGKIVETSKLTAEQLKKAKKLKLSDRWSLQTLTNQIRQNESQTDNVTKLMAKYGVSLDAVKTQHADEYKQAEEQDTELKKQQAKTVLDLANVLRTIGEEQFQRSTKFLEETLTEAQTLVDNYVNHTAEYNKAASAAFSALYPNETFTPSGKPSNAEQELAKAIRQLVPNARVTFGEYGSKEGLAKASINSAESFIFIKSGLVDEMGFEKVLTDVVKYEIANDVLSQIPVATADNIATLALGEEGVKYKNLTKDQKLAIAQMICFDQKFNQKTFYGDKDLHKTLFSYINKQIKQTSGGTKPVKIKFNTLLKIKNTFLRSIADAIANQEDLENVRKRYNLTEEEFNNKVYAVTRASILNNTIRLTDLNFAEESISRINAMKELLTNITQEGDFDWSRLYDKSYYKPEFVNTITQNEADFGLALRLYIAANYNMDLNAIQVTTILDSVKNTMSEKEVRDAAETVLTKEFLDSNPDLATIQTELANKLFYMVQTDVAKANLNVDSVVIEDNQIKGTGELKFFKGDVYERYNILNAKQQGTDSESAGREIRRNVEQNRKYKTQTIGFLDVAIQSELSLEDYQKEIIRATKDAYGMNVAFYRNSPFNRDTLKSYDDIKGFISKSRNTIYIKDDDSTPDTTLITVVRHEITHHLLDEYRKSEFTDYSDLLSKVKTALGDSYWKEIRDTMKDMYPGEKDSIIDEETLVAILNDEIYIGDVAHKFMLRLLKDEIYKHSEFNDPFFDFSSLEESLTVDELEETLPPKTDNELFAEYIEQAYNKQTLNKEITDVVESTPVMKEYFKNTKMRDNYNPLNYKDDNDYIVMFHGTSHHNFYEFKSDFIGSAVGTLRGEGYYFIDNYYEARDEYSGENGRVIAALLDIQKPLSESGITISKEEIKTIIRDLILPDYPNFLGTATLDEMASEYLRQHTNDMEIIDELYYDSMLSYDDYYAMLPYVVGYDGKIFWNHAEGTIAIVFNSNQIKDVRNYAPTESPDIRYSRSQKQPSVATQILKRFEDGSKALSEVQYSESNSKEYLQVSHDMIDEMSDTFSLVNDENYNEVRKALEKSKKPYAKQALEIFDLYAIEMVGKFNKENAQKIENVYQQETSKSGQKLALQAQRVAVRKPISDAISTLTRDGFKITVSDELVQQYDAKLKDKESYIKELEKQIKDLEAQLRNATNEVDKTALNKQLKDVADKKGVIQNGANSDILDNIIANLPLEEASKLQEDVLAKLINTAVIAQEEGKKIGYYLYDDKGKLVPFPNATKKLTNTLKKLKSFRMWAMLSSPVTWVRNWMGNQGMKSLDAMTNVVEGFLSSKSGFSEQQMKFTESRAGKELYKHIAEQNQSYIMSLVRGEDVKYETSAEKAAAIKRKERQIEYESANAFKKACLKAQNMTDWGLSTGPLGDEPVVFNSICKNMGNLVANNINFLLKGIQIEANTLSKRTTLTQKEQARLATLNKALTTKDAKDVYNALSKEETERLFDVCKERSFQQYFKNPNALSKWFSKFGTKHPVYAELISWVMPFPKVAANVLSMAYRYSPLSFFKGLSELSIYKQTQRKDYKGPTTGFEKAQMIRTFSEATVGTFMLIAGAIFAAMGLIDIDDDDYLGPSLKIGDNFKVSLSNLAPSMTTFSTASAVIWAWKNDKSAVTQALNVLYDNTLLGNVENLLTYGSFTDIGKNVLISYISQYIPAILKLVTKATSGGVKKDKSGNYLQKVIKTLGSYVPGVAQLVPNKINPYTGEKVYQAGTENWFLNLLATLSPLGIKWDTRTEIEKQAELLEVETTGLSGRFTINDVEYTVKNKEPYAKYRAEYINKVFNDIMSGKQKVTVEDAKGNRIETTYNKLTKNQKQNVINRLYTEASSMTKIKWWTDQGNKYVVTNRDLYNEYRKIFKNIIYKSTWKTSKFVES